MIDLNHVEINWNECTRWEIGGAVMRVVDLRDVHSFMSITEEQLQELVKIQSFPKPALIYKNKDDEIKYAFYDCNELKQWMHLYNNAYNFLEGSH